jgi:hypothetical protein
VPPHKQGQYLLEGNQRDIATFKKKTGAKVLPHHYRKKKLYPIHLIKKSLVQT